MHRIVAAVVGAALTWTAAGMPRAPELRLADAERGFAAAGLRDGVRKSFLAHLAEEAVVLRPFVTPARAWYEAHADRPGKLIWGPQYIALSAAGDLGLSSGPWRHEGDRDGKPVVAHGHFFSIWRRDSGKGWQVVFDHGISHRAVDAGVEDTALVVLDEPPRAASGATAGRRRALLQTDAALRARLAQAATDAYASVARADTLWLRDGLPPARGALPPVPASGKAAACGCGPPVKVDLAASGDLAYTIGGDAATHDRGADVRVWRFRPGSGWTLLADLVAAAD